MNFKIISYKNCIKVDQKIISELILEFILLNLVVDALYEIFYL